MRTLITLTLFSAAYLSSSALTFAAPLIMDGSEDSTTSSAFYNSNFMQGYDFTVTENGLMIESLGLWDEGSDGLASAYQVGLWDTNTQTLLASATIDSTDPLDNSLVVEGGSWRYETLGSPVALSNGSTYTLAFQIGPANLTAADSLLLTSISTHPGVTVDNRRFEDTSSFVFPTNSNSTGTLRHGNVNAQISPVPEPASLTLLFGLGTLGFAVDVRRRRKQAKQHTA